MFTGLVDDVGIIDRVTETAAGREFRIVSKYGDLADGESIAVNGACLTVRDREPGAFTVAAVVTSNSRSTAGADVRCTPKANPRGNSTTHSASVSSLLMTTMIGRDSGSTCDAAMRSTTSTCRVIAAVFMRSASRW